MREFELTCVLFDLDGTLVDTAPDLITCLSEALSEYGIEQSTPDLRAFISFGLSAMLNACVGETVSEQTKTDILNNALHRYENNIARHSQFFDGIAETLHFIEQNSLKWGIVTNKHQRFTRPLTQALNLTHRAACIISGDTTPYAKPHAEPMLTACRHASVDPQKCVYIGDAAHDITAGKNARMKTLAAVYGYLKPDDAPHTWGADDLIDSPYHLLTWLEKNLCR